MTGWKILIVDDDLELGSMLGQLLTAERFHAEQAPSAAAALERCSEQRFDLIILDIMMPQMDGLELLRHLRIGGGPAVLMLTARGDDNDRVTGLELGADDYLPKPFNPRELIARIRAILRRSSPASKRQPEHLTVGPLTIDVHGMLATLGGRDIRLTTAEFLVLEALARAAGFVQTRDSLSWLALGRPLEAFDRSIDTHVSNLRRKLALDGTGEINIRNSRGQGYVLTLSERSP